MTNVISKTGKMFFIETTADGFFKLSSLEKGEQPRMMVHYPRPTGGSSAGFYKLTKDQVNKILKDNELETI